MFRILCSRVLYNEEQSLRGHIQAPNPSLSFPPSWAWDSGTPERRAPPPGGDTIALRSQVPYPGSPRSRGGAQGVEVKFLARWPPSRKGPAGQVPRRAPPAPSSPAAASMRSASRDLRIPRVRGARPAPPPVPAPGARAPACGSSAPPGKPPLPGSFWAAGGATIARRVRGGARAVGSAAVAAAAGALQPASPTAACPSARRRPARWRGAARWRRCGGRSGACRSRRTPRRSARAACSASWTTRGS